MPTQTLLPVFLDYWQKHVAPYREQNPAGVYAPMYYITQGGGKRMRPIFMMMAAELFHADYSKALPACFAVELFHNFTLLHDDIMDDAPLRRGRQTVHEKWDTNTAILSGDLMMIESCRHLEHIPDVANRAKVTSHFLRGAVAVCEGQQMDVEFEMRDNVSLEEYLRMIELKTAALLAEGMAMAGVCMGASTEQTESIRAFGYAVGTAFQIQDDILDTYGDPAKFGKKVGGDIAQNKKTFLYLRALEVADVDTRNAILLHYSHACGLPEAERIAKVTALFDSVDIRSVVQSAKMDYTRKGFEALEALGLPESQLEKLKRFAMGLVNRER